MSLTENEKNVLATFREEGKWIVRSGYYTRAQAIAKASGDENHRAHYNIDVSGIVADEIEALKADQEAWEGRTDPERISAAFQALVEDNVMALQNFGLGPSDAYDDLRVAVGQARAKGETVSGYVMFHEQRTRDCALGYPSLPLQYGIPEADVSDERGEAFAQKVVDALKSQGLDVRWEGSVHDVIEIKLVWRARWSE